MLKRIGGFFGRILDFFRPSRPEPPVAVPITDALEYARDISRLAVEASQAAAEATEAAARAGTREAIEAAQAANQAATEAAQSAERAMEIASLSFGIVPEPRIQPRPPGLPPELPPEPPPEMVIPGESPIIYRGGHSYEFDNVQFFVFKDWDDFFDSGMHALASYRKSVPELIQAARMIRDIGVSGVFIAVYNPETGLYDIWDTPTP